MVCYDGVNAFTAHQTKVAGIIDWCHLGEAGNEVLTERIASDILSLRGSIGKKQQSRMRSGICHYGLKFQWDLSLRVSKTYKLRAEYA